MTEYSVKIRWIYDEETNSLTYSSKVLEGEVNTLPNKLSSTLGEMTDSIGSIARGEKKSITTKVRFNF